MNRITASAPTSAVLHDVGNAITSESRDLWLWPGHRSAKNVALLVVVAAVVALTYWVVVVTPYAFADDYAIFVHSQTDELVFRDLTVDGRPIMGLLDQMVFARLDSVNQVRYLRLFGLAGTIGFACMLYGALRQQWPSREAAALGALSIVFLPAFQVHVAWAQYWVTPFACLLGGRAAHYASRCSRATAGCDVRSAFRAIGLFLVALTIYQPSAMMFWFFIAVIELPAGGRAQTSMVRLRWPAMVAGIAMVLDFAVVRLSSLLVHFVDRRSALVQDPLMKVLWFVRTPLIGALNPYALHASTRVGAAVGMALLIGLAAFFRGPWPQRFAWIGLAAGFLALAYFPVLIVAESWPSFRTRQALSALVVLYCGLAAIGYKRLLQRHFRLPSQGWGTVLAAAGVTGFALLASAHVTNYFAVPQMLERLMLRDRLAACHIGAATGVWVVRPDWTQTAAPGVLYDEFGLPSSFHAWAVVPMVRCVLADLKQRPAPLPVRSFGPHEALPPAPKGVIVVDMRQLRHFAGR